MILSNGFFRLSFRFKVSTASKVKRKRTNNRARIMREPQRAEREKTTAAAPKNELMI